MKYMGGSGSQHPEIAILISKDQEQEQRCFT